ncbi:ComF family protein [Lutimonas sp.]|uniref:ComF family protein n=1 Tax=Lutimonas sp. TaxID=1872403 RepID=UPI003D9BC5BA
MTKFSQISNNQLEQVFKGRLSIESASALAFFKRKGLVQKMLHQCKYLGKKELTRYLGAWLASEMKCSNRFESLDYVIPVPMHPIKKKRRGYDQVTIFASAIASELDIELLPDYLKKVHYRESQSSKNRFERFGTLVKDFRMNSTLDIKNKHVLMVDDIITTGATMEACGMLILRQANTKLSLASMAFTA